MRRKFPIHPAHPERLCWGCDKYCAASDLQCGNGCGRTQRPAELLGDDWFLQGDWGFSAEELARFTGLESVDSNQW